jgi:hypothetical protein
VYVVAQTDGGKCIAILHSAAGGFAPVLKSASTSLAAFIFVDAVLPYPGKSCLATVPEHRVSKLKLLTQNGLSVANLNSGGNWGLKQGIAVLLPAI